MDINQFKDTVRTKQLPSSLTVQQQALWQAGAGNWEAAHGLIENLPDKFSAQIHAYLHRVEGDEWNANYWYAKAGTRHPGTGLEMEWETLVGIALKS